MRSYRTTLGWFVLCLAIAIPTWSQRSSAYSEPISGTIISGKVSLLDGTNIDFKILEGGMFKVRNLLLPIHLGLVPVLDPDGRVQVKIYEIEQVTPKHQALRYQSTVTLRPGAKSASPADGVLELGIVDIEASRQTKKPGGGEGLPQGEDECCVTCGSTKSCACSVSDTCGSCCVAPCC